MWTQPVAHIAAYYAEQYARTKYPALKAIMAASMALYRAMSRCKPSEYDMQYAWHIAAYYSHLIISDKMTDKRLNAWYEAWSSSIPMEN